MRRAVSLSALALTVSLAACGDARDTSDVLASAAGHELTVNELAALVAPATQVRVTRQVVVELADLWIDLTLLGTAVAEDPTLEGLDLTPVVDQRVEQEIVAEFRRSVVQLDTALSNAELRTRYAAEATNSEVRIRHILLTWPDGATPAQADSVRRVASELRDRIVNGGADFAALARELSQDVETAADGGDVGYFARGEKILPVERVAFGLAPGEVSVPFESELGVHLIRVEGRRTPTLARFRSWLQARRVSEAEARYVSELAQAAASQPTEGATAVVRAIAATPRRALPGVEDDRVLLTYSGGEVTASEVRRFLLGRPVPFRMSVVQASDPEIQELILGTMLRGELLAAQAAREGVVLSEQRRQEIADEARSGLVALAASLGLSGGASASVEEVVRAVMERTIRGEQSVVPLGPYSSALAARYPSRLEEAVVDDARAQVEGLRSLI